ncbi:thermonuclease family protein [Paracoccus isoporae]|uniref:thermonuclease family protein n=1 Tax=Paracoccus isoporae TaxID=591205 RepID=UPI000B83F3AA|nr:thermonuclease family protein [Paracoccus isoporae]
MSGGWVKTVVMMTGLALAVTGCRAPVGVDPAEIQVVDGDTIRWQGQRIRLQGLDSPELFSPQCQAELAAARAARDALRERLAAAQRAELRIAPELDRYGRGLARLALDGEDVARAMIRAGHARRYEGGARPGWCG